MSGPTPEQLDDLRYGAGPGHPRLGDSTVPAPLLPERPRRRLADRLLQDGAAVERRFVASYFGPDRDGRPLSEFVAEALQQAERTGEERADARYSALLDRIAGVILQRTTFADRRDRIAERDGSPAYARWADELRAQVDAIRSVLDPAEAAEVAGRVQRLREERS